MRKVLIALLGTVLVACAAEEPPKIADTTPDEEPEDTTLDEGDDGGHDDTDAAEATSTEVDGESVIEIDMFAFAYQPDSIEIEAGEPTILRFTNRSTVPHQAMIGDEHMQEEFAASDDHDRSGNDGGTMAVTVAPGETADLEVVFDEPGSRFIGCHLPGHYEAGMEASLTVSG